MQAAGLFFAIGHEPATKFLEGQLSMDAENYIITKPGTSETSIPGVFAAGDVQDKKWRQAVTAAGTGKEWCMGFILPLCAFWDNIQPVRYTTLQA